MSEVSSVNRGTYLNPVDARPFPDPFVLKFRGEYWAYCTGFWHDGKCFGIMRSRDLVHWEEIGGAMARLPEFAADWNCYWAPEVIYDNGRFLMYYSVGDGSLMHLRLAIAEHPAGIFEDAGIRLTPQNFAIDAHVFTDTDNSRHLFYATDFLDYTHIGTGTVRDRLLEWDKLEGNPQPVTRARFDWQVYDPQRLEKGGVRWHTVEGAFVIKHKGVYYEMFSGGNWQNISYGVSFATTENINQTGEWQQFSDGEKVLPILRTLPGLVVGPGHNSVIRGVNNRELYCVYHRWADDLSGRLPAIDRMDFAGDKRLFINGATHTPQPLPYPPTFTDFFDAPDFQQDWQISGDWKIENNEAVSPAIAPRSELICRLNYESFLVELSLRSIENVDAASAFGVFLRNENETSWQFLIFPNTNKIEISWRENGSPVNQQFQLAENFDATKFHHLRLEMNGRQVSIALDETVFHWQQTLELISPQIGLAAENMQAGFSGFALTAGFEDLFVWQNSDLAEHGWKIETANGAAQIVQNQLMLTNRTAEPAILSKGLFAENYELVVNARLNEFFGEDSQFGFYPAWENETNNLQIIIDKHSEKWFLTAPNERFELPADFAPEVFHQFRFIKQDGKLLIYLEAEFLGETEVQSIPTKIALFARNASVSFDIVRQTVL